MASGNTELNSEEVVNSSETKTEQNNHTVAFGDQYLFSTSLKWWSLVITDLAEVIKLGLFGI